MKFINYLTSISGIGIFPLISLLLFFLFFLFLALYVFRADKERMKYIAAIPIEDEKTDPNKKNV